jgi:pimeloyl-ACP methyl ester carboxylesterase
MAVFQHNGRNIGYSINGEGPAILAFHGTTQAANAWDQVRDASTEARTWIVFEFPGSGESDMPTGPIELDEIVDDALALMQHLGHEKFHVVGYSLGAVSALYFAARHTAHVETVTSLCGWSQSDARMRGTFDLWRRLIAIGPDMFIRYALVDGYTAATLEVIEPMWEGAVAMAATTVQPGSDAHLELDIRVNIEESLSKITAPCLVMGGLQDRWVDISKSEHIAETVSNATLISLPAGHLCIGELAGDIASHIVKHTAR